MLERNSSTICIVKPVGRVADLGWTPSYVQEAMTFPTDAETAFTNTLFVAMPSVGAVRRIASHRQRALDADGDAARDKRNRRRF